MRKKYHVLSAALAVSVLAAACGKSADMGAEVIAGAVSEGSAGSQSGTDDTDVTNSADTENSLNIANITNTADVAADVAADRSELFSKRDLSGEYDAGKCGSIVLSDGGSTADSKNVAIGRNGDTDTVTITGEGDYVISGALSNGMIIVDADKTEKVQLVLNGADIRSASSAAVYVKSADKVFVTLADGTENSLSNGGSFVAIDDNNIDAVIFSKDDLTLNGTGALAIDSPAGHGIVSKDELTVAGGRYEITATSHGMTGKDSVAIAEGSFRITAGEDAIKSDNSDDTTKGSIYIFGGSYVLSAGSDGLNALNEINISGGKITVEKSDEGLEARVINISGGETDIVSADDGLNATDKRASAGTAADGAKNTADAQNAGRGKGFGGGFGGGGMDEASINISGGIVRVNAEGDGLDSNGHLTVSGGEIYVEGSSRSGDSALDYDIDAVISGGTVVAAGQSGMAQNFGTDSTQGTILINTEQTNPAGSEILLLDSSGSTLVSWTAQKSFNAVVISCPGIRSGETYTVRTGGTDTSVAMEGTVYGQGGQFGGHGGGKGGMRGGTKPELPNGTKPEGMPEPPGGAKQDKAPEPSGENAGEV